MSQYALNLKNSAAWNALASSVHRPDANTTRVLHSIHPDLRVSWITACEICGFERPGDMRHCPGRRHRGPVDGKPIIMPHPQQKLSGYWGFYMLYPMYENFHATIGGRTQPFQTSAMHPVFIGWVEADKLSATVMAMSRLVYPMRFQGRHLKRAIETMMGHLHDKMVDSWYDFRRDSWNQWQKIERNRSGHPENFQITVPRNIRRN